MSPLVTLIPSARKSEAALLLKGFPALLIDPTTSLILIAITPALAEAFKIGLGMASWWITGYLAVYVMAMPMAGQLGDRFGLDRMLLAGIETAGALVVVAACLLGVDLSYIRLRRSREADSPIPFEPR